MKKHIFPELRQKIIDDPRLKRKINKIIIISYNNGMSRNNKPVRLYNKPTI